jgi:hypothetical protein
MVALYLLGHAGFKLRTMGSITPHRLAAAMACAVLTPFAATVDALYAVGAVSAGMLAITSYEAIGYRDTRTRVRAG